MHAHAQSRDHAPQVSLSFLGTNQPCESERLSEQEVFVCVTVFVCVWGGGDSNKIRRVDILRPSGGYQARACASSKHIRRTSRTIPK